MKTVQERRNYEKTKEITRKLRKSSAKPLPEEVSQLEQPEVINYFKMLTMMETGSTQGWELVREDFIKTQAGKVDIQGIIEQSKNISAEDKIMNDFNKDTNGIIEQISAGTEDVDLETPDKMKILEGDMPGQGKEKQGNWRG
tara:strand:+ start:20 stop:445 length:426 start_codon:yes stop_codon:yes gene_type:complete